MFSVPTPRNVIAFSPPVTCPPNVSDGTCVCSDEKPSTPRSSRSPPVKAFMEIGTFCTSSERFCAVTTTFSILSSASAAVPNASQAPSAVVASNPNRNSADILESPHYQRRLFGVCVGGRWPLPVRLVLYRA